MEDRRRDERRDAELAVAWGAAGTFLFARTTNVSTLGIFVRTEEPPPVDTVISLRFSIPHEIAERFGRDPGEALRIEARVAWTSKDQGQRGSPGMGLEFIEITRVERSLLMTLVDTVATFG